MFLFQLQLLFYFGMGTSYKYIVSAILQWRIGVAKNKEKKEQWAALSQVLNSRTEKFGLNYDIVRALQADVFPWWPLEWMVFEKRYLVKSQKFRFSTVQTWTKKEETFYFNCSWRICLCFKISSKYIFFWKCIIFVKRIWYRIMTLMKLTFARISRGNYGEIFRIHFKNSSIY